MAKTAKYGGSMQRQGGSGKGNQRKQTYMSGSGSGGKHGSVGGEGHGPKMSNDMRSDMSKITTRNPYPKGLA